MVGYSLQDINPVSLCIYWKELDIEVLIEVSPALGRENSSVYFLSKKVLGPYYESPKEEMIFHAFKHLIQNLKSYNEVKV